jgi:hypothetical protein
MELQAEQALLGSVDEDRVHWSQRRRSPTGAFYTPHHLVHFLVRHTLRPTLLDIHRRADRAALEGRRADFRQVVKEAAHLRVLDPACGCGRFLLVAFRALRCLHLWLAIRMARLEGLRTPMTALEAQACERALDCLYGIDISGQAVAAARAVLLHASGVAGEAQAHLRVGDATLDENDRLFEGVDVCLGNPPWGALGARRAARVLRIPIANVNIFSVFLLRCLDGLAPGGRLGFVLPRNFCKGNDYEPIRRELLTRSGVEWIGDAGQAFDGVTQEAVVLVARKSRPGEQASRDRMHIASVNESGARLLRVLDQRLAEKAPGAVISLTAERSVLEVLEAIEDASAGSCLRDWVTWGRGLEYGQDGALVRCSDCRAYNSLPRKKRQIKPCVLCGAEVTGQGSQYRLISAVRDDKHTVPVYVGRHVRRYHLEAPFWLDPAVPGVSYKKPSFFEAPKILLPKISPWLVAAVDPSDAFVTQGVYMLRPRQGPWSLFSLTALINSAVLSFYYEYRFNDGAVLTTNVTLTNLLALPVPVVGVSFEALLTLETGGRLLSKSEDLATERAVNRAAAELFQLSEDQIRVIGNWWHGARSTTSRRQARRASAVN